MADGMLAGHDGLVAQVGHAVVALPSRFAAAAEDGGSAVGQEQPSGL